LAFLAGGGIVDAFLACLREQLLTCLGHLKAIGRSLGHLGWLELAYQLPTFCCYFSLGDSDDLVVVVENYPTL
jgi:hypothetical protein